MIIGIPKELKNNENRIAITPAGVSELVKNHHTIYIETNAGIGSGFRDEEYVIAGAKISPTHNDVFEKSELIIKVKEPLPEEYKLIKKNQVVFTYFHFASSLQLTEAMIKSNAICISYETVENKDKSLPLLTPMSEVAGRMAGQKGAQYLEKPNKGRGILLGGVSGVLPAKVLVLGAGVVGTEATKMCAGLGADVTIMDLNLNRLRKIAETLPANVNTLMSNEYNIKKLLPQVDLIIGAVLIPGGKAPKLITKEMLTLMKPGSVVIDVAVDQGGCIETCTPTTHENPTFIIDDIVHYCVANMPGAVPYTSTIALTNATLPYIVKLANNGWENACQQDESLQKGLNIINGQIVYKSISDTFNMPFTPVTDFLN